jgi:predicted transcriptional regulator
VKCLSMLWSVLKRNISVLQRVLRHWSIGIGVLAGMLENK